MAVASSALAYKRMALMSATKVTVKPPSEEVLRARDDFQATRSHTRPKSILKATFLLSYGFASMPIALA